MMRKRIQVIMECSVISLLMLAGLGAAQAAQAAQNITQTEHINAELAPVANPEANMEKVGAPPEDPAAVVGTRFTYQGTLRLNNDRADGPYDFRFRLYNQAAGGAQLGSAAIRNDVPVTDGLFATELDFGQTPIDGDDIFLQIEVRDGASAGAYTVLSPRQRINATPYAVRALLGGDAGGGSSPWTVNGSVISYTGGKVAIGLASPVTTLHVKSANAQTAVFDTGQNGYISVWENGDPRGYLGSFQTANGSTNADFEIGTSIPNNSGKMHIVTQGQPRITTLPGGRVGVGMAWPGARLHVGSAGTSDDLIRVGDNTGDKFRIEDDGTTHIGGDIQQNLDFNGVIKAAAFLECGDNSGTGTATVFRQMNTVAPNVAITATHLAKGKCKITFPFNIEDRFYMAMSPYETYNGAPTLIAVCNKDLYATTSSLNCALERSSNGNAKNGKIHVMIF